MDRISSQPIQDLLHDEIFADFFNTFLNLPVFGQTPCYIPVLRQWELWPPLPSHKTPFYKGFISWLQQHRLQLFSRSDLCMHYLLCQQLLENLQAKKLSKEPENVPIDSQEREDSIQTECENTSATSAVLRSCIGSVYGILRFRKFLCGTTGGELASFWLIAAKILGLNEHNEVEKDLCHSLYRILKATHLSPGSGVLETCSITSASMLQFMSCHPLKSRRDVLKQMQTEAFWKLKHYWVPAYVSHCQVCLFQMPNELALLEVHQQTGLQKEKLHDNPEPSTQLQKETSEKYSSKVNTKQKWYRMTSGIDATYPESSRRNVMRRIYQEKSSCVHLPDHGQSHITPKEPNTILTDSKQQISVTSPHPESVFSTLPHTPVIDLFPPRELESTKLSPDWLHWALKADAYTGYPFHSFLTAAGKSGAAQLINLWQDLADLHKALKFDGNLELCFLLTDQFFLHCSLEIKEDSNTCNSIQPNGLGTHIAQYTMTQLKELLPCREAVPWVLQAQHELSQSLSSVYEEFLDEDDKIFLQFVTCDVSDAIPTKPSSVPIEDKGEHIIHRFRRALSLAEACSPGGHFAELDLEGFNLLQTEDLSEGGADEPFIPIPPVHMEVNYDDMSFEDLPLWNPKMAVEILSKQFQAYSKDGRALSTSQSSIQQYRRHVYRSVYWNTEGKLCIKKGNVLLHKPTARPRTLYEVLYDPVQLEFFRQFLRMNHAEEPLIFWHTVKKLASKSNSKQEQACIEIILQRFFQKNPEELLQCDAVIIGEISKMGSVSTNILESAQAFVFKSMEEKWFKEYQGTFPDVVPSPVLPRKRKSYSKPKTVKKAWYVIVSFIHSMCKFLQSMKNAAIRKEFETFLQQEVYNDSRIPTAGRYEQSRGPSSSRQCFKPKDPRRCFAGNRAIHINYLVNDLSFCIEVLRFYKMCDAVEALASYGMCGLNSEAILREKVNVIVKLFLACDTPPKFRINISESQRDIILDMARCGAANRALFHSALFTVFPTIIFFWKRFCTVRAMCGFCCRQTQKRKTKIDPSLTKEVQCTIRSQYDYPILRYTLSNGIQLLLPNVPEKRYKAESEDHRSPWKQNTPPTSLLLTPHSIMLEKTSLRSPSRKSSVFAHKV